MCSSDLLQVDFLYDDLDEDDDNVNYCGVDYNATVFDRGKNTVAAICQARLSASPSSANFAM